jgi:hypothetical protein
MPRLWRACGPTSSASPPIPTATPIMPWPRWRRGRMSSWKSRWPPPWPTPAAGRVAAAGRAQGGRRLHPAPPPLVAAADRRGPRAGRALRLPPEPEPAKSSGPTWEVHKALMQTTSPIVDCGVHYVDVMCQITDARAGRGARHGPAPVARDRARHVQLRPFPGAVRRWQPWLVRGGLGPDDVGHRLLREGRGQPQWRRVHPHARKRAVRRPSTPIPRPRSAHPRVARAIPTSAWRTSPAIRRCATANRPSWPAPSPKTST